MKKGILILGLLLSSVFAFGQNFHGGFYGGLLSSQVDGDSHSGYKKASIHLGAFVKRQIDKKWGTQMELRYIRKGALENRAKDGFYYRSRLNYVEIPLLALYKSGKFTFEAGPAFGVLISSSEEDLNGFLPEENTKAFNPYELSFIAGFSYTVNEKISLNFRGQYSILPVRENFSDNIYALYYFQKYSFNNLMSFAIYYHLK